MKKKINRIAQILEKTIDLIEKCGGPGGTPGPCPRGGRGGAKPQGSPKKWPQNMTAQQLQSAFDDAFKQGLEKVPTIRGNRYSGSGKFGQDATTGQPTRELYQVGGDGERRAWQRIDGSVVED